jgi:hypothetical protein
MIRERLAGEAGGVSILVRKTDPYMGGRYLLTF